MNRKTSEQIELEREQVRLALRRPGLARDAVSLLAIRLIELRYPEADVRLISDEAIEVIPQDGKKTSIFLANLLAEAERNPAERPEIVERYVNVCFSDKDDPTLENIIPTVRHADYRSFIKEEDRDIVTEHLIGELWTVWAIDYPESISVMSAAQINSLMLTRNDLRIVGLTNTRRLLNDLEFENYDKFFVLTSTNSEYLSSALLMDEVWDLAAKLVDGDLVLSAPARDTVIFTGTQNVEGLRALREQATYVVKNGHHVLAESLFQRVNGKWTPFT
jgi:uncharacterized protein YtpQ (UPF0354 family)